MNSISKYIIWGIVAAIVVFLLWYFSAIVSYILISAVLAIVGKPLVEYITRVRLGNRRVPRWMAALVTLVGMWAVAVLFLWFFIPLVVSELNDLMSMDLTAIVRSFEKPLESIQRFGEQYLATRDDSFSLAEQIRGHIARFLGLDELNDALSSTVTMIGSTIVAIFSITFITFFFLKQENLFQNMLVSLFPKRHEGRVVHALHSVTRLLIRYFTGILAESTIIMLLLSIILMALGFEVGTSFFMGAVMGVLNVVPYIGPIIGAAICLAVGMTTAIGDASLWNVALLVGLPILLVKGVDDFVLQPVVYSNRVKAHPLEIFLVILIAGSVAGMLGMLLAIPCYTVIRVFAKEFFSEFPLVQKLTENMD